MVNYKELFATDNCPGVKFGVNPPSGSIFPVGTTTVTAGATDAAGNNAAMCMFDVTVITALPSLTPQDMTAIINGGQEVSQGSAPTGTSTTQLDAMVHDAVARVDAQVTTGGSGTSVLTLTPEGLKFDITVQGLSGPITAAHFHNAPFGVNGPVVRTLTGNFVGTLPQGVGVRRMLSL